MTLHGSRSRFPDPPSLSLLAKLPLNILSATHGHLCSPLCKYKQECLDSIRNGLRRGCDLKVSPAAGLRRWAESFLALSM